MTSLFTMKQHLCVLMNKKLTLHRRNYRQAVHLCPVLSLCTNDHVPVSSRTMDFCLNIVGLSLSGNLLNNHLLLIKILGQYDFVPGSEFDYICSASTCFISYSYLFLYSFRKSFRRQKSLQGFHNHFSSRSTRQTVITRQSLFLIYYLFLPPTFNSFSMAQDVAKFSSDTELQALTISQVSFPRSTIFLFVQEKES